MWNKWTASISGLPSVNVPGIDSLVQCILTPRHASEPRLHLNAWILPKITGDMPHGPLIPDIQNKYSHLALPDLGFYQPGPVDVLLGADLFSDVMDGKRIMVSKTLPMAFGSVFDWVLIGGVKSTSTSYRPHCSMLSSLHVSLEELLEKFWTLEEPTASKVEDTEDGKCEVEFKKNCTHTVYGRYKVAFRQENNEEVLQGSRQLAVRRLQNVERKLQANPLLYDTYRQFMLEYETLWHMSLTDSHGCYDILHHAVVKFSMKSDDNISLRVVFDASAKTLFWTVTE
ncbi:uncharacterized protein LOC126895945 [Daktulosphaira vitifoliae]|uniref:uncharacterized protein LOC126895945 n=1 Tax=Daktulosphaira vitifoliae TaxID=58002 RepID=UPI0021A9CB04|nr:uncharacterized protein LOC126895945 [Daktulosphaira vitifoliae]